MEAGNRRRSRAIWLLVAWVTAWAVFSLPWTSMTSTANWERFRPPHVRAGSRLRSDHVLNFLFYVPAAPLAAALGWPVSAGVAAAAAISVTAETVQVFSHDRAPDGNDIVANIGGAIAGALAMLLYRRRAGKVAKFDGA